MDDVEPNRYTKQAGFVIQFGGAITRGSLNGIERAVIIIARGAALSILGVSQFWIQVPAQPYEPLHGRVESVQKEVSHTNDQECFPRDGENEKAACVDKDVDKTRERLLALVQSHPIRLEVEVAENVNQ